MRPPVPAWWEVLPVAAGLLGLGYVAWDRRRRAREAAARVRARLAARRIEADLYPAWAAARDALGV